ncbi:TadE/TadG family type IV pilus assembly protein [Pigmentiphaga aceris]|nr:TadE family protein [Pigmentiphaga aceris]
MMEFLIVALPLLGIGMGSVEFAHWQLTRQAVDHAMMEAAREGAVTNGDPVAMRRRFDAALLPLFGGGTSSETLSEAAARMAARSARIESETGVPAMRLEVLGPGRSSFADFADPALNAQFGRRTINNDYLAEAHARDVQRGWPEGRGPSSGQDRFDANQLRLRLTYLHAPMLPGLRALMKSLSSDETAKTDDAYATQARARAGMLVMTREFTTMMQSHPVEWEVETYRAAWGAAQIGDAPVANTVVGALGELPGACGAGACLPGSSPTIPSTSTPWTPPTSPGVVQAGDPACGISVCCAPA